MNITHKSTYSLDMTEAEFKGLASFILKHFDPDSNCTSEWAQVYDMIRTHAQDLLDEDDYSPKRPSPEFMEKAKEVLKQCEGVDELIVHAYDSYYVLTNGGELRDSGPAHILVGTD